jgi:hypothetical protein
MDRRDFDFWLREAARLKALEEMAMLSSMRLAMWADGKAFAEAYSAIERDIAQAEGTHSANVEDNWAGLRAIGRR